MRWRDLIAAQRTAVTAVQRSGRPEDQARIHRDLGRSHAHLGDFDEAHHHLAEALGKYGSLRDDAGLALTHQSYCAMLDRQGRSLDAIHHASRSLELHEATEDPSGQSNAHNALGWLYASLGDYDAAIHHCRQ